MTKIEWADKTWNPVTGCTKISEGCKNCYAERMSHRLKGRFGYPEDEPFKVTLHPDKLDTPLKWKKPRKVFVCSMGDLFHDAVPFSYVRSVWNVMETADKHTFMILTKRPERMLEFLTAVDGRFAVRGYMRPLPNVILGVTVENQANDWRIPLLLQCPAAVRFMSYEPALGPLDVSKFWAHDVDSGGFSPQGHPIDIGVDGLDWIICGGETGPGARTMDPTWARGVRDQCKEANVPFFFKKMGQGQPTPDDLMIREWPTQK